MHVSLAAELVFHLFGLPISNSILTTWIVMAVLIGIAFLIRRQLSLIPSALQSVFELVYEYFLDTADSVIGNRTVVRHLFPFVMTLFLFITLSNWTDVLPGLGSITIVARGTHEAVPLFRPPTTDLNLVASLALMAVGYVQYLGLRYCGPKAYLGKFFNFSSPIAFFVGILELFSELTRTISFTFRLFGNIFAGEVLLTVMFYLTITLLPYVPFIPLPFYFLEMFVGMIQAFVFCFLVIVLTAVAVSEHGGEHQTA